MDGRTAIAKILKIEGIEFVTCFPLNPVLDAVAEEGIRLITARTERKQSYPDRCSKQRPV